MQPILIQDIMIHSVVCANHTSAVMPVIRIMRDRGYSCMVIADKGIPIGIFTERDLLTLVADGDPRINISGTPIGALMTEDIVTVRSDTPIYDAMMICQTHEIRHLPVVNEHRQLIGLVTQTDLVRHYSHELEARQQAYNATLKKNRAAADRASATIDIDELQQADVFVGSMRAAAEKLAVTHQEILQHQNENYAICLVMINELPSLANEADRTILFDKLVGLLYKNSRANDRLYRYAEDKIMLLSMRRDISGAEHIGERIVELVASADLNFPLHGVPKVTVNTGVAVARYHDEVKLNWEDVVTAANTALHFSTKSGTMACFSEARLH